MTPSATGPGDAAYCLAQARRFDRDRYLTALFAGAAARDDLMALYAFNVEVARIRELVHEPMMGLMRLQWWRDAIAEIYGGGGRRHQVVQPLARAIGRRGLPRLHFDRLIDAREADLSELPPPDLAAMIEYVEATAAGLGLLALGVVGGGDDAAIAAVRSGSIAWGLTGLLRAVPFHAAQRRIHLPLNLLTQHGVMVDDLWQQRRPAGLAAVARIIAAAARGHLDAAAAGPELPRRLMPALMPGTLARINLRLIEAAGYDLWAPQVRQGSNGLVWRLLAAYLRSRS